MPFGAPPLGLSCPEGIGLGDRPVHLLGDRGVVIKLVISKAFDPFHMHPSRKPGHSPDSLNPSLGSGRIDAPFPGPLVL